MRADTNINTDDFILSRKDLSNEKNEDQIAGENLDKIYGNYEGLEKKINMLEVSFKMCVRSEFQSLKQQFQDLVGSLELGQYMNSSKIENFTEATTPINAAIVSQVQVGTDPVQV